MTGGRDGITAPPHAAHGSTGPPTHIFVREFRPLREAETRLVAKWHGAIFGIVFD